MASSAGAGAGGRANRELRVSIEEVAKKLSLWSSATFRPILTHDDLEPILAAAGFVPLPPPAQRDRPPAVTWREYAFLGGNAAGPGWLGPRPRLPYPRLDGLHLKTYEAFLGAVEACLGAHRVANLFHVRLMPVTNPDRVFDKVFRPMRNFTPEEDGLIVYREGTLDERTMETCSHHTSMGNAGHVFPGISCRDLGYLRKLDGNCHEEGCCAVKYPSAAGGYNSFPIPLKDICRNLVG
ncbi:hypothetical protein PR202_gb02701 [Eleusine coracana subsp. coracana]|uniref:Uncharacterized protein n=1 Tax=Eleusine coracana subsp. coracana TaxID=191504 RepID=A0AAV5DZZ1_ELECO|nr:hypothetical protein QOZ80_8BG0665480 [Eleusine coracana subsp. coracana]GJN15762.1 hypothetical protein PR202_gb02701 [Eleusine coracana subsp. coracana]